MDIAIAKRFVYHDMDSNKIYISQKIDPILEMNEHLISVWGVVDTEVGEKMFALDFNYCGEPILMGGIMGCFVHYDYFMDMYHNTPKIFL